jgi:hypothetical protein
MSIKRLEVILKYKNIRYEKRSDTIIVEIRGAGVAYPLQIADRGWGKLDGEVWFPQGRQKEIPKVDLLCSLVTRELAGPELDYDPDEHQFLVKSLLDPEHYMEGFVTVAHACNKTLPLCLEVGATGIWDVSLVDLALKTPMEVAM